jgi:DNA-binding transcriptional LysR family regulator
MIQHSVNIMEPINPHNAPANTSARFAPADSLDANALELFARIVRAGSFSAAARRLGLTRAAVSRRLASMEAQVGQPLLARTTRALSLTDAGRRLAPAALSVLDAAESARGALRAAQAGLAGRLRITALPSFGHEVLLPLLLSFRRHHPAVRYELLFTDRRVDLMREGVDVAFRVTREPPADWVARTVLQFHVGAYARVGSMAPLETPAALVDHPLLLLGAARDTLPLRFEPRTPVPGHPMAPVELRAEGAVHAEDLLSLARLAEEGAGVLLAPDYCVARSLAQGTLIDVLPHWHLPIAEGNRVQLLTLAAPQTGPVTRAFVEHVMASRGSLPSGA